MAEWIGRTLSKVEIQKLLGRGGMADVYLGRHTTLNRPVAVKVLHSHLSENETLLARFRQEAQAVAAMRHPHIVQVLDFDIADDRPYIVMELLEGVSLKDYLAAVRETGQRPTPETIITLIAALASALQYAHARGIIHRDVKPANIMLRRDGPIDPAVPLADDVEVVLTDFGIARMADATAHTASGSIVGTPQYMSPEQVRGDPADGRSDIYSLGIILYEILSGQLPFDGDTQASILIKQISEMPSPIPDISSDVQNVIQRALAKDPAQRYQKAVDFAAALQEALSKPDSMLSGAYPDTPVLHTAPRTRELNFSSGTSTGISSLEMERKAPSPPTSERSLPAPWLAIGAVVLVVLVGVVAVLGLLPGSAGSPESADTGELDSSAAAVLETVESAASPTSAPLTAVAQPVVGQVFLRDGRVALQLQGVEPPPEGSNYQAWLTEPGVEPLSLGLVEVTDDGVVFAYDDPESRNLISQYRGVAVSIEPASDTDPGMSEQVVYSGQIPQEQLNRLRLMFSVARDLTFQEAVLEGVTRQSITYDSHLDNTIHAIEGTPSGGYDTGAGDGEPDLGAAKLHAEHVINIIVGRESPEFDDYNSSGRPENPGDGVGLENYLLILQDSALAASSATGASADMVEIAGSINGHVNELLLIITDAKNDELSVTAADTLEEVLPLAEDMGSLFIGEAVQILLDEAQNLDLAIQIDVLAVQ